MKAITLWQPWASLIALGAKTIETRSWQTSYRGPIAIHAAASTPGLLWEKQRDGKRILEIGDYTAERDRTGFLLRGPVAWPYRLPQGAVVATATLTGCLPILTDTGPADIEVLPDDFLTPCVDGRMVYRVTTVGDPYTPEGVKTTDYPEQPYGDYTSGRYGWLLEDIQPLRNPVAAKGRQGLWNWKAT